MDNHGSQETLYDPHHPGKLFRLLVYALYRVIKNIKPHIFAQLLVKRQSSTILSVIVRKF